MKVFNFEQKIGTRFSMNLPLHLLSAADAIVSIGSLTLIEMDLAATYAEWMHTRMRRKMMRDMKGQFDQMRAERLAAIELLSPEERHSRPFPEIFDNIARMVYGGDFVVIDVGTPLDPIDASASEVAGLISTEGTVQASSTES